MVQARDASIVVRATNERVPGERTCVLFEWLPGRRLRDQISAEHVRATGAIAALVHEHGTGYTTQQPTGALVADRVSVLPAAEPARRAARGARDALDEGLVARRNGRSTTSGATRRIPRTCCTATCTPGNVMVSRGRVTLIDFQDLIWGFEIQDLTTALLALGPFDDRDALRAAFRAGYETVRPWPDADPAVVAAVAAARHLNVVNYCLNMGRTDLHDLMARHARPVVEWMRSRGG